MAYLASLMNWLTHLYAEFSIMEPGIAKEACFILYNYSKIRQSKTVQKHLTFPLRENKSISRDINTGQKLCGDPQ